MFLVLKSSSINKWSKVEIYIWHISVLSVPKI